MWVGVGQKPRHPWLLTTGPLSCPPDAPWKPTVNGTVVAVEGETVSILCSTQSNPDPIITIFKEKQILATVIYESELQLELPAVTPEDDGEYWCVAENQYGQRATAFNLSVECEYPLRSPAPPHPHALRRVCSGGHPGYWGDPVRPNKESALLRQTRVGKAGRWNPQQENTSPPLRSSRCSSAG